MQDINVEKNSDERLIINTEEIPTTLISNNPFDKGFDLLIKGKPSSINEKEKSFRSEWETSKLTAYEPVVKKLREEKIRYALKDVKKFPQNSFLFNNLGLAYLSNSELTKAEKCFNEAVKLGDNKKSAKLNLASVRRMKNDLAGALDIYNELNKEYPNDKAMLINIVNLLLRQNKLDEAEKMLLNLWKNKKINFDVGNKLAIVRLLKGDMSKAISILRKCLLNETNNAALYNNLGVAYIGAKMYKKALNAFKSAINILPNYTNAISNYVKVLKLKEGIADAISYLENYLDRNYDDPLSELLAEFYLENLQYDQSLRRIRNLIINARREGKRDEEVARLLNNLGVVYHQMINLNKAEKLYEEAIKLDNYQHILPILNIIDLYLSLNNLRDSKVYIDLIVARFPDDKICHFYLGEYNRRVGNISVAIGEYEEYLKHEKYFAPAYLSYSFVYSERLMNYDKAIEILKKAKDYVPNHIGVINNLAYNYLMKNDLEKAALELDSVSEVRDEMYLTATRGLLQIKRGNLIEGRRLYNEAAKMTKNSSLSNDVIFKKDLELLKYYIGIGMKNKASELLKKLMSQSGVSDVYRDQFIKLVKNNNVKPDFSEDNLD